MSTTGQQVLDLAVQRSSLNNPDTLTATEIVRYIANAERYAYIDAVKLNPEYFGKSGDSSVRALFTDSWPIRTTPGGIGAPTTIEVKTIVGTVPNVAVGDNITLVDRRFPKLALSPRAYLFGRALFGQGTDLGVDSSNMVTVVTVFFAELPVGLGALETTLSLPDEWIDLIVLPLAKILALRDQRGSEVEIIQSEYDVVLASFRQHVQTFDGAAIRPINSVPIATALDSAAR